MRLRSACFLASFLLVLTACGGGGSDSGSQSPAPNPQPVAISFAADTALIGSGLSPTLTWNAIGTGTACTAGGGWSGSKSATGSETVGAVTQTTSYTLSCTAPGAQTANAAVTVVASTALPPPPTADKVWSEENVTSLDYVRIPYGIRSMVWSAARGLLYGVTTAESPTAPNSLVSIDPVTRATQVLPLGGEAWFIDITKNSEFVYIGMSFGGGVKRVRTSDLALDLAVPIGDAFSAVQRVVPSPTNPHTFAVVANRVPDEYAGNGLFIYDDATQRPASLVGPLEISPTEHYIGFTLIDVDWNADGTLIYAMGNTPTAGLFYVDVDAQGAHFQRHRNWPTASPGSIIDDRYFSWDGRVFNMTGPVNLHARVPDHYFASPYRLPVPERGKIFSIGTNLDGRFEDGTRIMAFDFEKYTYLDSIVFDEAADFRGGFIIPWGTDGLVLTGQTESIIAHGSFVAAGGAPPISSATLPLVASGVARNPDRVTINFRVVNMGALAVTTNPCGKLFVTTSMTSGVRPGSVLEVNPDDLTITRSANAGVEPYLLAASDDCSTLYVGSQDSSSAARVRTSDLVTTDVLPLGGEDLSRARSMSVAPGQAQTVAISLGDIEKSLCSGTDQGVVIYDGATPRPVYRTDGSFGIKSIVFGANAGVLYGEDFDNTYVFDVDASGLSNRRVVMPNRQGQANYDMGRDLYFDPVANRVFNAFGYVFDVTANAEMPQISLAPHGAVIYGCGTPGQTRVTDPVTGKLFWVGNGLRQDTFGFSVYARNGLTRLGSLDFGLPLEMGFLGIPAFLSRLPNNRLAFVTSHGYLILLDGALLAP